MIHHISKGVEGSLEMLRKRQSGEIKYLTTFSKKLDSALKGGIDYNRIITLAGMSGSGKSTVLEQLKNSFYSDSLWTLSFEFEMLIEDQIVRALSSMLELNATELLSIESPLKDDVLKKVEEISKNLTSRNSYYVSKIITVKQIQECIYTFVEGNSKDKTFLFTIDHSLLVKDANGKGQKQLVDDLYAMLTEVKVDLASKGYQCVYIVLNQLNRDIGVGERVTNPYLHYPTRNDLFASSSSYFCSDYVIIIHRPSVIDGIGNFYGPPRGDKFPKGLPIQNPKNPNQDMVYFHLIKNRFGKMRILTYAEAFEFSKIHEIDL